jgi:hypothetical protein
MNSLPDTENRPLDIGSVILMMYFSIFEDSIAVDASIPLPALVIVAWELYVCMDIHIYRYVYINICIHINIYIYIFLSCIYIHIFIFVHLC